MTTIQTIGGYSILYLIFAVSAFLGYWFGPTSAQRKGDFWVAFLLGIFWWVAIPITLSSLISKIFKK